MAANGRRAGFHSSQPNRQVCPCCEKKGLGVWHRNVDFLGNLSRDRSCRYCGYTQFQSRDIFESQWVTDAAAEASYNKGRKA